MRTFLALTLLTSLALAQSAGNLVSEVGAMTVAMSDGSSYSTDVTVSGHEAGDHFYGSVTAHGLTTVLPPIRVRLHLHLRSYYKEVTNGDITIRVHVILRPNYRPHVDLVSVDHRDLNNVGRGSMIWN